jgi:hypothetical protein
LPPPAASQTASQDSPEADNGEQFTQQDVVGGDMDEEEKVYGAVYRHFANLSFPFFFNTGNEVPIFEGRENGRLVLK